MGQPVDDGIIRRNRSPQNGLRFLLCGFWLSSGVSARSVADPPVRCPGLQLGGGATCCTSIGIVGVHRFAGILPVSKMGTGPLFAIGMPCSIFNLDRSASCLLAGGACRACRNFDLQDLFPIDVQTSTLAQLPNRLDRIDSLAIGEPLDRSRLCHRAVPAGIARSQAAVQL